MTSPRRPALRRLAAAGLTTITAFAAALALGTTTLAPTPAAAASDQPRTGTERFYAGEAYTGMFADPSVMRAGGRFYGVATNHDGLNLPLMSSDDLRTWVPRAPLADYRRWSDWSGYNDAMPTKPAWAALIQRGRKTQFSQWAPSVARVNGRYVAAYSAARQLGGDRRSCIGLAVSDAPEGPFTHPTTAPTVCFEGSPRGVIDPDIHVRPNGDAFLLWKQEGVQNRSEPALMTQRLSENGSRLKSGSRPSKLMELVRGTWKGGVIENPSMVRHRGKTYLFYAGDDWKTDRYATGYAVCDSPLGPCRDKTHASPLLASDGAVRGPGGADAFTDREGNLRVAYAAWDPRRVGPTGTNARMLHIATLSTVGTSGGLLVTERG